MIEEQATIVSLSNQRALVEIKHQSSCSSCDAKSSCGTSSLSQLFGNRPSQFYLDLKPIKSSMPLQVGDAIMIGIEDASYLNASALIYLLPLVLMFGLSLFAEQVLMLSDPIILIFAIFGLWFGFQIAKYKAKQNQQLLTPQFIKKL